MTQPNEELKPYRSERFFIHGPIFGSDPGMCPYVSQAEKVTAWLNAEYERNCHTQEAPVAQVEVYRKALEEILHAPYGQKEGWFAQRAQEALLTSKPEPVAQLAERDQFWKDQEVKRQVRDNTCSWCHQREGHDNHSLSGMPTKRPSCEYFLPDGVIKPEVAPVRKWEAEEEK